jgi:hypothetical protein
MPHILTVTEQSRVRLFEKQDISHYTYYDIAHYRAHKIYYYCTLLHTHLYTSNVCIMQLTIQPTIQLTIGLHFNIQLTV